MWVELTVRAGLRRFLVPLDLPRRGCAGDHDHPLPSQGPLPVPVPAFGRRPTGLSGLRRSPQITDNPGSAVPVDGVGSALTTATPAIAQPEGPRARFAARVLEGGRCEWRKQSAICVIHHTTRRALSVPKCPPHLNFTFIFNTADKLLDKGKPHLTDLIKSICDCAYTVRAYRLRAGPTREERKESRPLGLPRQCLAFPGTGKCRALARATPAHTPLLTAGGRPQS